MPEVATSGGSWPTARSCHGHKFRLCDLRSETRELSRGKKHPHFPITLAYRKCNQAEEPSVCNSDTASSAIWFRMLGNKGGRKHAMEMKIVRWIQGNTLKEKIRNELAANRLEWRRWTKPTLQKWDKA